MYLCFQSNRHRYNDDDVPKSAASVCHRITIIHICGSYESQTNHTPSKINISSYYSTFLRTSPPMLARSSTVRFTRSALMPQMYFQLFACECVCMRWWVSKVTRVLICEYVHDICMCWSIWSTIRACMYARTLSCVCVCVCVCIYKLAYLYGAHKKKLYTKCVLNGKTEWNA